MDFNTIAELFYKKPQQMKDKPCLGFKKEGAYTYITYAQFGELSRNLAKGLVLQGVNPGDRVAIISQTRMEWVLADAGIILAGGVNVPLYDSLTPVQCEYILKDSGSKMIFVSNQDQLKKILSVRKNLPQLQKIFVFDPFDPSLKDETIFYMHEIIELGKSKGNDEIIKERVEATKPEDLLTIIYTSGTTGNPKGVMLTHRNLISNIQATRQIMPVSEEDISLAFLPLSHSLGRMADEYMMLYNGATIYFAESIDTIPQNLLEVKPTVMISVPRLYEKVYARVKQQVDAGPPLKKKIFQFAINTGAEYNKLKDSGKPIPLPLKLKHFIADKLVYSKLREKMGGRLKFFISGGAPLSQEIAEFFYNAGILILEGYGLTETSPVTNVNTPDNLKFGTVGKAIPGVEIKIAEDGEIWVRGPNVMKGYYNLPEQTREVLTEDGWFATGDIGEIDEDGFLKITDRKKELIVTAGGKNVAPAPIENALKAGKYISMAMCIGDKRKFISALIAPNFEQLENYAKEHGIEYKDRKDLITKKPILEMMEKHIDELTKDFARFEKIKKFTLIDRDFLQELDELTPTLKLKRRNILKHFEKEIEEMYKEEE